VSASWGFDPQTASGDEIVRERMPERMSLRLDESANGEKTKAMVLAIGVFARASLVSQWKGKCGRSGAARASPSQWKERRPWDRQTSRSPKAFLRVTQWHFREVYDCLSVRRTPGRLRRPQGPAPITGAVGPKARIAAGEWRTDAAGSVRAGQSLQMLPVERVKRKSIRSITGTSSGKAQVGRRNSTLVG